jgi:hypothetical protein
MQAVGEQNASICAGNDFALIKLDPRDYSRINPSIPFWGGPNGLHPTSPQAGDIVYGYGNSELRGGVTALSPKTGVVTGRGSTPWVTEDIRLDDPGDGWSHQVYTVTPGVFGDSGSAYLGARGGALGVMSTWNIYTQSNQVADLGRALAYMRQHTDLDAVRLAEGTERFAGNIQ